MNDDNLGIMGRNAFYFMPDISGFANFVEDTSIEHSTHIISELLEILLDNNVLEMELAEVEGDALFMYSEKEFSFSDIEHQVSEMLNAFHWHLQRYDRQRICSCGACSTAMDLKLKFLVHHGRLDFIQVKHIKKPFGQDVNRIHRLLKNDVPISEYLLLSHLAFEALQLQQAAHELVKLDSKYDISIRSYYYVPLDKYRKEPSEPVSSEAKIGIDKKAEIIVEKEIAVPLQVVYELVSNFKYRKSWDDSLTSIQFEEAKVNRVGSRHNCIIGNRQLGFKTVANIDFQADKVYAEKTEDIPMTSNYQYYILLDAISENKTLVKVLNFVELNTLGKVFKKRVYKKINYNWNKKLKNLAEFSREYYLKTEITNKL